jgi:CheY-like chemotaxis protein
MLRWSVVDGRALELDVCDDGPGIQPAMREQLFQPFERGAASGGATAGTGLGLSISRQLVRAMHGELTLLPGTGQGAVFRIRLPLAPQSEQTVQPMPPNSSLFGALPTEPGSVTELLPDRLLLYVEDDPVNALLMSEFIARSPALRLHVAVDLDSGVAAANALQPALVLTDMHLPDGSGHDLLRLLRTSAATAGLRIVALSADAMPDQIQAALDAGFDAYWTKPVDFSLLRTRLMALLGS